jgi:4-hydroxy-3-methylbut-2-en-1-yl diphosphate reductase
MKKFEIPVYYKSSLMQKIKQKRELEDPKRKDFTPAKLDFGDVVFYLARHFGFCYGVHNAIEISYNAIEKNPFKKIYLLSEMIHNPEVNADLLSRGVKFIMETNGRQIIPWSEITGDDIVIVPAFGTTVEIENILNTKKVDTLNYDTTCPFVEKVWNKAKFLGIENFTIVVHGKFIHEETRATFSHSKENAPTLIIKNITEAKQLRDVILGNADTKDFFRIFDGKYSAGFDPEKDLLRIGVVNQTTMLATDTREIAELLKKTMEEKFGKEDIKNHFADTRDTLCYATHDNQSATYALLEKDADFAIVVGGYNSSNTSHIVELCKKKLPTYFIRSQENIISKEIIRHYDLKTQKETETINFITEKKPVKIILTSGASCPDNMVEGVMLKLLSFFDRIKSADEVLIENV